MAATSNKKSRKSYKDNERLAVVEQRLENFVDQLPELQKDVKTILSEVGQVKLTVATLPTWESIKPVHVEHKAELAAALIRIQALETASTQITTGARTLVFVGGLVGALIGWGVTLWAK